jgi:hypothetical protein
MLAIADPGLGARVEAGRICRVGRADFCRWREMEVLPRRAMAPRRGDILPARPRRPALPSRRVDDTSSCRYSSHGCRRHEPMVRQRSRRPSRETRGGGGAQAGHDQTYETGSQAAATARDGTHTEPLRPSCPAAQRTTPSKRAGCAEHRSGNRRRPWGEATNSAKLTAFPASSVIPPQRRAPARHRRGGSAGDIAAA